MSRNDLKELGEYLDEGQAGLVVVGVTEMEDDIKQSMSKADKVEIQRDQGRHRRDRTGRQGRRCRSSRPQTPRARTDHSAFLLPKVVKYHTAESIKSCCFRPVLGETVICRSSPAMGDDRSYRRWEMVPTWRREGR